MKNSRIPYFDFIRVVAISTMVLGHYYFAYDSWNTNLAISYILKLINVPEFLITCMFMISGTSLLNPNKTITTKKYFKYIIRIFLGLLIFGFLYYLLNEIYLSTNGININLILNFFSIDNVKRILFYIFTCQFDAGYQLWFSYVILIIYIFLPIFRLLVKKLNKYQFGALIIVLFIFLCLIPIIWLSLNNDFSWRKSPAERLCFGIVAYLTGYFLINYLPKRNYIKNLSLILFVIFSILTYVSYLNDFVCFSLYIPIWHYFQAVFFLIWISYSNRVYTIFASLNKYMYGIYLINGVNMYFIFWINLIWFDHTGFQLTIMPDNIILTILIQTVINLILSFICVYLMRKIPFVRKYIL